MRIRIVQKPAVEFIDGVRLDQFRPGHVYQVGSLMAVCFSPKGGRNRWTSRRPESRRRRRFRGT